MVWIDRLEGALVCTAVVSAVDVLDRTGDVTCAAVVLTDIFRQCFSLLGAFLLRHCLVMYTSTLLFRLSILDVRRGSAGIFC